MSSTTHHRTQPQQHHQQPPTTIIHRLQNHPTSYKQIIAFLAVATISTILFLIIGLTVTAVVLGLIFFSPIIIITTPLWLPLAVFILVPVLGFLCLSAFVIVSFAVFSWFYRYYKGLHPPGSDRFDYARHRIVDTAREVKDYASGYGGYLHSKVKDAAPGA